MPIYFGSAACFLFFAGTGVIAARYFNFTGTTWYFFMGLMGTMGLTTSAAFYYLQNKFYQKRQAKKDAAEAAAPEQQAGDPSQWVKEANTRLGQSRPGIGIENLPMVFVVGDRGTAKTS